MPALTDGNYLNTYVAPQLLQEFRNYNDEFVAVIPRAPEAAVSADGIRFNKLINNVQFLVNNSEDFTATAMAGKKGLIGWDTLDTTPTKVTDAEIQALPYDKRAEVRLKHGEAWKIGYRDYILNKLAISGAGAGFVFLRTTGETLANGRKRLTFNDLIDFESAVNALLLPNKDQLFFNLCAEHSNDLKADKAGTANNRDAITIDPTTGAITRFYRLKIFENNAAPIYTDAGVKKAPGAIAAEGDQAASTFFYGPNTIQYVKSVKILYSPELTDTDSASPTSKFRLQSFALCDRVQEYGFGSLVSDNG